MSRTTARMRASTIILSSAIIICVLQSATATPKPKHIAAAGSAKSRPRIELVFALDTTGSMSGLIHAAKEKIWSIASSMAQANPAPDIAIGLVAFRDRGDSYVTRRTSLTRDIDRVYEQLMSFEADGGGDTEESVNQALHEAVTQMNWSTARGVYRVIFLVGDAPPHLDYLQDVQYQQTCQAALVKGIVINTIQCGQNTSTTPIWREIAGLARGNYFAVEQSGGAVIASTPYDEEMAEISAKLDETRLYYGKQAEMERLGNKKRRSAKITSRATKAALARRASFNASAAGAANFLGGKELLHDIENSGVQVADVKEDELPEALRSIEKGKREAFLKQQIAKRKSYRAKIKELSKKRQAFLNKRIKESKKGAGLSQKVYDVVRKQAADKKINFESAEAMH